MGWYKGLLILPLYLITILGSLYIPCFYHYKSIEVVEWRQRRFEVSSFDFICIIYMKHGTKLDVGDHAVGKSYTKLSDKVVQRGC